MSKEPDASYHLRRERAARKLAMSAADEHISRIHLALADRHAAAAHDASLRATRHSRDEA